MFARLGRGNCSDRRSSMISKMEFDRKMLEDDIKEARISDLISEAVFVDYGIPKVNTKYHRPEITIEYPEGRNVHLHTKIRGIENIKYLDNGDGIGYEVC